ncbi:MAG: zinc ribbon domain-containing protein [Clostridia bacterium]|nr:zinc ribbon domain-containing protein [Clostridia bacterium]
MAFCVNCGENLQNGAKFCASCGTPVNQNASANNERKAIYDGEIHKCPNCGEALKSFETICPTCQFELRGTKGSNSVKELADKLEKSTSENQKITIIKNYPIPNTKEDIFEFMFLAYSNFDAKYYAEHQDVEDISDAWLAKVEQCYQKAKFLLHKNEIQKIEEMYMKIKGDIQIVNKKDSKRNIASIIMIIIGLLIMTPLPPIGVVLLICGIVRIVKKSKKINSNNNKAINHNYANTVQTKTGFSTWSTTAKILWIILNIYTLGIPAIIYACSK